MKNGKRIAWTGMLCLMAAWAGAAGAAQPVRVFRVGSSSFGAELLDKTKLIVDASGRFTLDWDAKRDSAGYTRLDAFIKEPGFYEEWCGKNLPRIAEGKYDYVIFQTISWLTLTPVEQNRLAAEILPDLAAKIRQTGAQVILYDKYMPISHRSEKDPRAREWVLRYPDGQRLNYLLHVFAAKKSGIGKITFGGAAVREGWETEPFKSMSYLYCDAGHPGHLASYISACCLAYLLTGIDPVGSPVRSFPFDGWSAKSFSEEPLKGRQAFYDAWKDRVRDGQFHLADAEARALQELAMKHHRQWSGILDAAVNSDAEFAKIEAGIRSIQAGMDKPEQSGMSAKGIAAVRAAFEEAAAPGEMKPAAIEKMRRKAGGLIDFQKLAGRHLAAPAAKEAVKACNLRWEQNNSKLRDDVLYEAMLYESQMTAAGNRDEAARMKQAVGVINSILNMGGYRLIYERLPEEKRAPFLANETGPLKRFAPSLNAELQKAAGDPSKLFVIWETYLSVWNDPNLMDKLKETKFSQAVFLEADQEFQKKAAFGRTE